MINNLLLLISGLAIMFALLQLVMYRQCKRNEGKMAPDTPEFDDLPDQRSRVYYFYSSNCGPCRKIAPMVDQLREQHTNLVKVNISEHAQLARGFGVVGVPCFVLVVDKRITKIKVGRVSESWLTKSLTESP